MQIIHKIDNFLFTLFPELSGGGGDNSLITSVLEKYYTYGPYKPQVTIDNEWVTINIDSLTIISQDSDYRKAVTLCENGKLSDAKPILQKLIDKNPTNSEYHRILGQIFSEEGNQEEAINSLIDALKWDSKNGYALLMMGNIFAKFKDDLATAMKYYDQALIAKPKDNITINNIGANLMQQGKLEEAKKYFWEAVKINDQYPNTHFALGMIAEMENDLQSAFYSTIKAIKLNNNKDVLYQNSVSQSFEIAQKIVATDIGKKLFREYRSQLENKCKRRIDIIKDENIPTAAKIEFAENHNRENHCIRYKPSEPAIEHLIMHELVHLDFATEAREQHSNMLFTTGKDMKIKFIKDIEKHINKLSKQGYEESAISNYIDALYSGINMQIFNIPVDLFIEDFLYNIYPTLRPFQFVSLYKLINEGSNAVTDKNTIELTPSNLLTASKILNLINAIQFKDLYGIDLLKLFNSSVSEMKQAEKMWNEFLEYRNDRKAGEEYEIIANWGKDLNLNQYFELIDEEDFRSKPNTIDDLLKSIEEDPFGNEVDKNLKEKEMERFQQTQKEIGTNMAVVMFMVDALQYFANMAKEDIMKIAYEIAMYGTQGFHPEKKDYNMPSIPGKVFSGYHILAYYYVSWKIAIPEMVDKLQLPFDKEYQLALSLNKM